MASLAFPVGGVGILSVMLMSVRERMREVGLRRALGARKRDVQLQFVLESVLVAVAGLVPALRAARLTPLEALR